MTGVPLIDFIIAMCSLITAIVSMVVAIRAHVRIGRHKEESK
jgi:hypothetical protein